MKEKIKVLLVEDEYFWQANISKYINKEGDIEVVQIVNCKEQAIEATETTVFDVILLDLNLTRANLDGLEALREISKRGHKVIALTAIKEEEVIINSFERGAVNYINKSSIFDIIYAIREAHKNRISIHPDGSEILRKELIKEKKLRVLTSIEREIYDLQQRGLSKAEIASTLFKSVNTLRKQVKKIKEKLKG